jgi:hypothetical protein
MGFELVLLCWDSLMNSDTLNGNLWGLEMDLSIYVVGAFL